MKLKHRTEPDIADYDRTLRMRALQLALQLPRDPAMAREIARCLYEDVIGWLEGQHPEPWDVTDSRIRGRVWRLIKQLPADPRDARAVARYLHEHLIGWLEGYGSKARPYRGLKLVERSGTALGATGAAALLIRIRTGWLSQMLEGIASLA